jgi:hypothetical protein
MKPKLIIITLNYTGIILGHDMRKSTKALRKRRLYP